MESEKEHLEQHASGQQLIQSTENRVLPNLEMEPTLLMVRVIMSPRRAAHFAR
jgi:hypothetical protein